MLFRVFFLKNLEEKFEEYLTENKRLLFNEDNLLFYNLLFLIEIC